MPTFADFYPCRGWPAEVPIWIIGGTALLVTILLAWPVASLWKRVFAYQQPGSWARCAWGLALLLLVAMPQFSVVLLSRLFCLFQTTALPGSLRLVLTLLPFLPFAGTSLWVYGLPEGNTRLVFRHSVSPAPHWFHFRKTAPLTPDVSNGTCHTYQPRCHLTFDN